MVFDTHAHVHAAAFDVDRPPMLARAREAGVGTILTVGCDLEDSRRALEVAEEFNLLAAIGIHPHEAKTAPGDLPAALDALIAGAARAPVALGETGLDYYYEHSPRPRQRFVLVEQVRYARARKMPLIFHHRDAYEDFVGILRDEFVPPMRGVVHCFTGDRRQAWAFADFGLLLGIGGVVTFKTAAPLREAVQAVGLDRIILETDCPYLAPVPHRGKRNEPAFITATAECLAGVLQTPVQTVIAKTTANARALFGS